MISRKEHRHPVTGAAISRQRALQLRLVSEGTCWRCCTRPVSSGKTTCTICLERVALSKGTTAYKPHPSPLAWKQMDWSRSNHAIARHLGISPSAVRNRRRKLAPQTVVKGRRGRPRLTAPAVPIS